MSSASIAAPSSKRLEGKVVIITGGASGIGAASVRLFSEHGATVVIADIQDNLGRTLANNLGRNVSYVHCDISEEQDVINLIDTTVSKHGRLDVMFNNAGIVDNHFGSIINTEKSDLERVLRVNVVGSFLGAKHAARVMLPRRKGCILFTASACTSIAGIATHTYALSKHGIVGLAKNLAGELGQHGIRVNCVSPSGLVTGATAGASAEQVEAIMAQFANLKGKILRVEDVAAGALYLASDESGYVSGLNLVMDGGYSVVNPSLMNGIG